VNISEFLELSPDNHEILNAFCKTQQHLDRCEKAHCSISGGADSDVMLDIVTKADTENKVTYGFYNTGIEYEATKKHLDYLRAKYNVEIKEYKAKCPVPLACKKYGQPFISKFVSEMIQRLQKHNFKWEDKPFDELIQEYPNCRVALKWWCNMNGEKSRFNIKYHKLLKEFMILNPPDFLISNKCCDHAKKNVAKEAAKSDNCDLVIMGVRKAEGGIRSAAYKSCFSEATVDKKANFRPLFWITDSDKKEYENIFNITHSDCYKIYGLNRTGCAGCPFGKNFEFELEVIKKYEPKLYKAVNKIFGKSYEYTRKYYEFRQEVA
jgi:3'-phosphoadenosine 5'-phosphosulfate sulfotransferase (PAPS reductase)/FAD synthetase